jgi:copper transport protein
MMRAFGARALALLVVSLVLLFGPLAAAASGHASLVGSNPSPDATVQEVPAQVSVSFDAPVSVELAGIKVYASDGSRVDRGSTALIDDGRTAVADIDDGGRGTYTVAWTVVSSDSHVLSGSFVFHVGERTGSGFVPEGRGPWLSIVAWWSRWIGLTGTVVVIGAAACRLLFPAARVELGRQRGLVVAGAAAAVAGAAVRLVAQVADTSGRSFPGVLSLVDDAIGQTRTGQLDLMRVLCATGALFAALWWTRRWAPTVGLVASTGALLANSLSGHAWSVDHRPAAVVTDLLHQFAGAVWLGALAALVVTYRADRAAMLRRFTTVVGAAIALVVVSGLISTWLQVRTQDALTATAYGRTLGAKVLLVALTAAAGLAARRCVQRGSEPAATRWFGMELLFAAGVLATTAALVDIVPGREYRSGVFGVNVQDELGPVSVTLDPARTGENALHLYFFDQSGAPREVDVAEARVSVGDIPPRKIDLYPLTTGHYTAGDVSLPTAGRWLFTVTTLSDGQPATLRFEVPIR